MLWSGPYLHLSESKGKWAISANYPLNVGLRCGESSREEWRVPRAALTKHKRTCMVAAARDVGCPLSYEPLEATEICAPEKGGADVILWSFKNWRHSDNAFNHSWFQFSPLWHGNTNTYLSHRATERTEFDVGTESIDVFLHSFNRYLLRAQCPGYSNELNKGIPTLYALVTGQTANSKTKDSDTLN